MNRSKKVLITTVAVIGISAASVSLVSARGGPGGCNDGYGNWQQGSGHMMKKFGFGRGYGMERMMEEKLDRIKYKLRITEDQEPAWQEFTDTVGQKFSTMRDKMQKRGSQKTVTERVELMRTGAKQMNEMANAIEKLHAVLTPEQKKVADELRPMRMRGF